MVPTTITRITANITAYSAISWASSPTQAFQRTLTIFHLPWGTRERLAIQEGCGVHSSYELVKLATRPKARQSGFLANRITQNRARLLPEKSKSRLWLNPRHDKPIIRPFPKEADTWPKPAKSSIAAVSQRRSPAPLSFQAQKMTFSISLCSTPRPCMATRTRLNCASRSAPCSKMRTPPQLKLHNARNATERRVLHAFFLSSLLALEPSTRREASTIP